MDCDPITFSPPLYIQRDEKINEIISFHKDVIHVWKYFKFEYKKLIMWCNRSKWN